LRDPCTEAGRIKYFCIHKNCKKRRDGASEGGLMVDFQTGQNSTNDSREETTDPSRERIGTSDKRGVGAGGVAKITLGWKIASRGMTATKVGTGSGL